MRRIKMLVAASAAALLVLGVAAIPASATQICSVNDTSGGLSPCSPSSDGWLYGTDINSADTLNGSLVGTTSTLNDSIVDVNCTASTADGSADSDGTNGSITTLSYSNCTTALGASCVVTTSPPYPASATDTADETGSNGTLEVNVANGVNVNCGSALDCTVTGTAQASLWNPGNSSAPGGSETYDQATFDSSSGSNLSGCGVGQDGYTATYELAAGNSSAGALSIY